MLDMSEVEHVYHRLASQMSELSIRLEELDPVQGKELSPSILYLRKGAEAMELDTKQIQTWRSEMSARRFSI